jgi:predicted aspartyl protease
MGHVYMDIIVKGERGEEKLEKVMVDTGATYTFIEEEILEKVGATRLPTKVEIELGDGKKVLAKAYGGIIIYEGKEVPSIILTFPGTKRVVGVETLEALGLRVNPKTHALEYIREKGVGCFYSSFNIRN